MATTPKKFSQPTGLFWPCQWNSTHHKPGVALPIMKKDCFFLPKCFCGSGHSYCPPDWTSGMGLTRQQCEQRGLQVLSAPRIERTAAAARKAY